MEDNTSEDGSVEHSYVDKYFFGQHHEYAYAYAQQVFRLGLVTDVMPFCGFAFIEDPAVEVYVLSAVYQMPLKNYVYKFVFDKDNEEHVEWALLAMEIGFWGMRRRMGRMEEK